YETAHQCHATGNVLNKLFQGAIRTTKRIKTETNLSKLSCNIPFLSMKRVLKKFDDLEKRSVYIVGLGEIGSLMLKYVQENTTHIYATSRTFANAQKFADVLTPIPFEDRYKVLEKCDVLILCSACKEPIIKKDEFEKFVNRPILVIDLGSPRNAESTIGNIPFVDYVCVDELQKVVDENRRQRMVEMLAAKQILQEGIDEFMHWRCMDDVVKKISERAERLINSAKNEACELLRSMPKIDEDSRSKIEMLYVRFAKRVANEFLYKVKDNNTQSDVIKFLECLEK
ncbi:MAG: glutamyl-tRNA reductase, partial [Fibrobacter sp.]|nr:glutamyl-tRNA reductase [Fibrobacter sp.]